MKKNISFIFLIAFSILIFLSCDPGSLGKKYGQDSFNEYLEESEAEGIHTADSLRQQMALYSQEKLPLTFSQDITLLKIDTASYESLRNHVKCFMYFTTKSPLDSITLTNKVDSIVTKCQPFKRWLEFKEGFLNACVEIYCYKIYKNDTIQITIIPTPNWQKSKSD